MFAEGEYLGISFKRTTLERGAIGGNSPVFKKTFMLLARILKYCRAWQPGRNQAELSAKAK